MGHIRVSAKRVIVFQIMDKLAKMLMNAKDSLNVHSCVLTPLVPIIVVVDQALSWVQMAIHVQILTIA